MPLSWQDQDSIARELLKSYPDQERLLLSVESLRRLIIALPGFSDTPVPPRTSYLNKILWTWMRLADEPGGS
jgi:FeS assembly protein IscX